MPAGGADKDHRRGQDCTRQNAVAINLLRGRSIGRMVTLIRGGGTVCSILGVTDKTGQVEGGRGGS